MKVVRIIARLNVGGPARHVSWLTAALRRAGHESVLVAGTVPPGEDDMSYFALAQGVEPLSIPEMSREISPKDALTVWKLYRLFVRLRPDIIHTHTAKAGTVGRVAGVLYRWLTPAALALRPRPCRFVHTYHGHVFHSYYGPLKTRLFLVIERTLARFTDRIIVISPQQFREIHEQFGVGRAEQFAVVPLGLDLSAFAAWPERRQPARAQLVADADAEGPSRALAVEDEATAGRREAGEEGEAGEHREAGGSGGAESGAEALLVGIVGRLTEIKNHRLFLEAVKLFKERAKARGGASRRVRFFIIGDGHLRQPLEAYARELKVDGDVTFAGTRDDPENFYAALDIVALTSLNEGTPLTLIEAMANGRAVVATGVGGVVDLLGEQAGEGETAAGARTAESAAEAPYVICERGLRVASGDAEGLAEAFARLAADEDLRRGMGERGRLYVERCYSVERLVTDVTKLYEDLLATEKASVGEKGKWSKSEGEKSTAL